MMKKRLFAFVTLFLSLGLVACGQAEKPKETASSVKAQEFIAPHSDVRLKFNQIVLAKADQEFKGGSTLASLKELYGEPVEHSQTPAGDVTLEAYRWQFDQVQVSVQFYEDSAITRSISYFEFIKEPTVGLETFEKLQKEMTYAQVVDILGEADALSEAVSSDGEELQALWTSGLKTDQHAQIQLLFVNGKLNTITQTGLSKE